MKDNYDRQIPYVSKELCDYLRECYSLQNMLSIKEFDKPKMSKVALGYMHGVDAVISMLEGIYREQEENAYGVRGKDY